MNVDSSHEPTAHERDKQRIVAEQTRSRELQAQRDEEHKQEQRRADEDARRRESDLHLQAEAIEAQKAERAKLDAENRARAEEVFKTGCASDLEARRGTTERFDKLAAEHDRSVLQLRSLCRLETVSLRARPGQERTYLDVYSNGTVRVATQAPPEIAPFKMWMCPKTAPESIQKLSRQRKLERERSDEENALRSRNEQCRDLSPLP